MEILFLSRPTYGPK